jgi:glutamyl-Q tRNA(Asp) synthetase
MIVARFAPSPTGLLHLGNAYSAFYTARAARHGRLLLRIEDIDTGRCRPEFEAAIFEDLAWLGLSWETPVRRQSEHMDDYAAALTALDRLGVTYPCFCTRKEIAAEVARSPAAPHGPDGALYPGTCRRLTANERSRRLAAGQVYAVRLDCGRAADIVADGLTWRDRMQGLQTLDPFCHGDVVVARKDVPTSYHLAVTVDDAIQGVTLVTRGSDLFQASHVHRLLQALLGLATPDYDHHDIISDRDGQRLAKRKASVTLRQLREEGVEPDDIRRQLGFD